MPTLEFIVNATLPRRGRPLVGALLALLLLATACGGSSADTALTAEATAGDTAPAPTQPATPQNDGPVPELPEVTGTTVSGAAFDLNDLAGQDIVLWYWAPW